MAMRTVKKVAFLAFYDFHDQNCTLKRTTHL